MTRHVLAGIDGTPQSEAAALWAAEEADRRGTGLRIVHVWPWLSAEAGTDAGAGDGRPDGTRSGEARPGDLRPVALRALSDLAGRIRLAHPGLPVDTVLIGDDPADGLAAAAHGHELLVLGSRGLSGFAGLLVGSVGLAVAGRADVPVVMVRAARPAKAAEPEARESEVRGTEVRESEVRGTGGQPTPAQKPEVVVGLDLRHPADAVLDFAFTEAELRGARLRAVHGWDLVPAWTAAGWMPPLLDAAEQEATEKTALAQVLAPWRDKHPGTDLVAEVRLGGGAQAVLARSAGADLVVIGRRDRRPGPGPRLGSVAHAVLHHSPAAVAVVPHP